MPQNDLNVLSETQIMLISFFLFLVEIVCAVKEEKDIIKGKITVVFTCLSGRVLSQGPLALSAVVPSVFVEEVTHNIHMLRLPPHSFAGLLSIANYLLEPC